MKPTFFEKAALGLAGATALGIGAGILFVPHAFYAGYGITLAADPNLLSELRAPGAALAGFGLLMLLGLWRQALLPTALATALTVFIAFPAGRLVGIALDGMPSGSIVGALVIELAIAALCLAAFRARLRQPAPGPTMARPAR